MRNGQLTPISPLHASDVHPTQKVEVDDLQLRPYGCVDGTSSMVEHFRATQIRKSVCMNIPDFGPNGLLPPYRGSQTASDRSPYVSSTLEFVERFATSKARIALIRGLLNFRGRLYSLEYKTGVQFVDGSFVQDIEALETRDPGDIDVFNFLVRPDKYRNDQSLWLTMGFPEWKSKITDRAEIKKTFKVDSKSLGDDDFTFERLMTATIYWYSLFSHRRVTNEWKGFVKLALTEAEDASAIQRLAAMESAMASGGKHA